MRPKTSLGGALDAHSGDRDRINDAQAKYFVVSGEIEVSGPGESLTSINFPVLFIDKPRFSYGSQLGAGMALVARKLPTASATVTSWGERIRDDGTVIYAGAVVTVVTTGPPGQVLSVHWHMEGVGLQGPTPTDGS